MAAQSRSYRIWWTPPTTDIEGQPITDALIYTVYFNGSNQGSTPLTEVVFPLNSGCYDFNVTASYADGGAESAFSETLKVCPDDPSQEVPVSSGATPETPMELQMEVTP